MAEKKADDKSPSRKRRVVKKAPESIREKRAKAADTKPKKHRVRSAAAKAGKPVSATGGKWRFPAGILTGHPF